MMKPFKLFSYFLVAFIILYVLFFSKKVIAENKYYHYEIDEQIKISEDKDYANHSRDILREEKRRDQARKKHKLMRKQEQLAHEKTKKEQIKLRRRLSLHQKNQERLELKYEEEVQREEKRQERLHLQYVKQKRRERQLLMKEQARIENRFYNNQPVLK